MIWYLVFVFTSVTYSGNIVGAPAIIPQISQQQCQQNYKFLVGKERGGYGYCIQGAAK